MSIIVLSQWHITGLLGQLITGQGFTTDSTGAVLVVVCLQELCSVLGIRSYRFPSAYDLKTHNGRPYWSS